MGISALPSSQGQLKESIEKEATEMGELQLP